MTKEEFDAAVKALRGKVVPKNHNKKKADCTPEEWAATVDYGRNAMRKQRAADPEKYRASKQKWRASNREKVLESKRRYRAANLGKVRASSKRYRGENTEKVRDSIRSCKYKRLKADPTFKMLVSLRKRLYMAVKGGAKKGSAVRDLGCTIAEFWTHMESLFQPGMTRDNIGKAWEIDHVFPLSKAKVMECRVEFLAANNWRNLQPLTPKQNREKGDTVTPEAQAMFYGLCARFARECCAA